MKCPKCRIIEMTIDSVTENKVKHYCRNCGLEETTEIREESDNQE